VAINGFGVDDEGDLPVIPFFLRGTTGELFCIYHAPRGSRGCRGVLLHVPAFADEMNWSRRLVSIQARRLASEGWGVLQVDLHGCGDSAGEFRDSRWEIWLDDIATAVGWLRRQEPGRPITLWGIRLGALLAIDFARRACIRCEKLILWQPVLSGKEMITEFIRISRAGAMFSVAAMRAGTASEVMGMLKDGQAAEVAGYELTSGLVSSIEQITFPLPRDAGDSPLHWVEVVSKAEHPGRPAALRTLDAWTEAGRDASFHRVIGPPFWTHPHAVKNFIQLTEQWPGNWPGF
jgi:exosortase A-associated hydrolase 2